MSRLLSNILLDKEHIISEAQENISNLKKEKTELLKLNNDLEEENIYLVSNNEQFINEENKLKQEIVSTNLIVEKLTEEISTLYDYDISDNPYEFIRVKDADYERFNLREQYILNRWNQLADVNTTISFGGINIGDDINDIVGPHDNYPGAYQFADEEMGVEGFILKKDHVEIGFIGTRVKSMLVDYTQSGEVRYLVDDVDELLMLVKEDYVKYEVVKENDIIIVTDKANKITMKFIYFDNQLTIFVDHTERFSTD